MEIILVVATNVAVEISKRWFGSETAFGRSIKFIRGRDGPWGRSRFRQKASTREQRRGSGSTCSQGS